MVIFHHLIVGGTPPFAKNGYETVRSGSKRDKLREDRRSSGSRARIDLDAGV